MDAAIRKYTGRKHSEITLQHLRANVNTGRYSTTDVKSWLIDQRLADA